MLVNIKISVSIHPLGNTLYGIWSAQSPVALDSRLRSCEFEHHQRHCIVFLGNKINERE